MKRTLLSSLVLGPALLLAALLIPGAVAAAGPITSTACTDADGGSHTGGSAVTCNLWAKTGTLALPGTTVPIWGFADTASGAPAMPGPVLVADAGDTVTVNLANNLAVTTSIVFDGQPMVPDTTGVAAGGTTTYSFTAAAPGTYLYEAGLLAGSQYQVSMGLYGVLVVRPAGAPGQAYADASTAFADEALVVLGEIDPKLNTSATPASFDLRYFAPKYQLVNGQAYTTTPASCAAPSICATSGATLLLRYANAGIQHHSMGVLGLRQSVLAADGSLLTYPRDMAAETIAPGQTADVLLALPSSTAASTRYALYDAAMLLNNNGGQPFGGMLAFIDAATSSTTPPDTTGPVTSNVTLAGTALSASVTDAATGGSGVAAAEYFIDTTGLSGAGTAMAGTPADPATVTATIATATGVHTVYVHGQDGAGNWGAFSSVTYGTAVDTTGPTTSALALNPNPSNGSVTVALSATADDTATGNSNVTAAEYNIDGGAAVPMIRNTTAPTVSLTATIPAGLGAGDHPVTVRSQDAAGNWGATASITLTVVPATGPTTSGVAANPSANNGAYGQSSSNPSVRVTATFTDTGSTVAAGEGFIDAVGSPGTGFPFVANDGVFNALSESGYADIPLATINLLPVGNHTISVRGKNAAGVWGATASITYLIDKTAPTFTGITLTAANPTLGGGVSMTVNGAVDPLVGGLASGIAGGEYWIDTAAPTPGAGTLFTGLTPSIPASSLTTGSHTVGVRVRDGAGNWSTTTQSANVSVVAVAIFSNGFDTGGAPWGWSSRSTNTTSRLNATAGAAMVGARGLQAQGNNTNYVQYNFGTTANPAWPTYDARFYFRPNGNTSAGKDILRAASGTSNASFNAPLFSVRYRLNAGTPQVQVQVGASANAAWTDILGGTSNNVIEVVWQAVGSVGPNPGTLTLYVNGVSSQTLTTTSTSSVAAVRLGSVTNTGNATLMYFDAFASKRSVSPLFGP